MVYRVSWILTGIALAVMFLVVMAVIVTRYVVDLPFFWGEELARYAMFYMIMLGSGTPPLGANGSSKPDDVRPISL